MCCVRSLNHGDGEFFLLSIMGSHSAKHVKNRDHINKLVQFGTEAIEHVNNITIM